MTSSVGHVFFNFLFSFLDRYNSDRGVCVCVGGGGVIQGAR